MTVEQPLADKRNAWPILATKRHDMQSVFQLEALLRETRGQKGLPTEPLPAVVTNTMARAGAMVSRRARRADRSPRRNLRK